MDDNVGQNILFSDYFTPKSKPIEKALEEYGAFNVSLLSDLPLFIDPFLLFNSKEKRYQELHEDIINYVTFLRDKSVGKSVLTNLVKDLYLFKEVKQTWLGFTAGSNEGHGLGDKFARALDANLARLFGDEENKITDGKHFEKLCLLGSGVGRDCISDFTTNLISGYLAEYTQTFAQTYLTPEECAMFFVKKSRFNYESETWEQHQFYLPKHRIHFPKPKNDYILLVPKNILTRDDTWINYTDLIKSFEEIRDANEDEALRNSVDNFFMKKLPKDPDAKKMKEVIEETLKEFPVLIDYYIKMKEDNGDKAVSSSNEKVVIAQNLFLKNFTKLASLTSEKSSFYKNGFVTLDESVARANCLKDVIEAKGGYQFLYDERGIPISREEELAIAYHFIWFNRAIGNTTGDLVDPKKAIPVTFKLGSNRSIESFFDKKNKDAIAAKDRSDKEVRQNIIVVFCFSSSELIKIQDYKNNLTEYIGEIIVINASKDYQYDNAQLEDEQTESGTQSQANNVASLDTPVSEPQKSPRVFISYSHDRDFWTKLGKDPNTQRERVYQLAEKLRDEGVICDIDQHIANPPQGWARWMMDKVEEADFVLVVATEIYNTRFRGRNKPDEGHGTQWEGAIITQELYNGNGKNEKFIPIVFDKSDIQYIPLPLQSATYYNVGEESGYDDLYYYLTNQPPYVAKPLGPIRQRPPRS